MCMHTLLIALEYMGNELANTHCMYIVHIDHIVCNNRHKMDINIDDILANNEDDLEIGSFDEQDIDKILQL